MNEAQRESLKNICRNYRVDFREEDYHHPFDLPAGYVAGWVGGNEHRMGGSEHQTIYVRCGPRGGDQLMSTAMTTDVFSRAEAELLPCVFNRKVPQLLMLTAQSHGWQVRTTARQQKSPILWLTRDGQEVMVRFTHSGFIRAASTYGQYTDEAIRGGKLGKIVEWLL